MINCKKLYNKRKELGLTQDSLAKKIGIDQTFYSKIEKGERVGSIKTIQAICKVLNISASDLLEEDERGALAGA